MKYVRTGSNNILRGMVSVFLHGNQLALTLPEFKKNFGQTMREIQRLSHLDLTQELKYYLKLCATNGFIWALFCKQFVNGCVQNSQPSLANCTCVETQRDPDLQIHSERQTWSLSLEMKHFPLASQEMD